MVCIHYMRFSGFVKRYGTRRYGWCKVAPFVILSATRNLRRLSAIEISRLRCAPLEMTSACQGTLHQPWTRRGIPSRVVSSRGALFAVLSRAEASNPKTDLPSSQQTGTPEQGQDPISANSLLIGGRQRSQQCGLDLPNKERQVGLAKTHLWRRDAIVFDIWGNMLVVRM